MDWIGRETLNLTVTFSNEGVIRARIHRSRVVMSREIFGWLRKLLGGILVTARFSLILAVVVVFFLIWENRSDSLRKTSKSSPQASVFRRPSFATL